jgi:Toprim domain
MGAEPRQQTLSTDELKSRLLARIDEVVHRFAPEANGSYHKGNLYFTLNPGRADRNVGSFCVTLDGPYAGQWRDYAVPGREGRGDIIDLIGLSLGIASPAEKFKAAREFLGLDTEDPVTRRKREDHAARMRREREARKANEAEQLEKTRKLAHAIWLSGQERLIGTPVDHYLAGRSIHLATLPHMPAAIRFHPACRYYWEEEKIDPETGEVLCSAETGRPLMARRFREMPAMLTAIARGSRIVDCHRTYLERVDGRWVKARVEDAKKVFTDYTGGSARLCGELGPRGGHLKLGMAPDGATVYVTEGIENALSLAALRALTGRPPAFIVAAGSLWNMAHVDLPTAIGTVVLAADNDSHPQAQEGLKAAVKFHAGRGREVCVWRSAVPGEDLNDALQCAMAESRKEGAA